MRIDKEKIKALCELSDEAMWQEIVKIGREHGFTLPSSAPSHSDMEKIREAVSGGAKLNLAVALKIIDTYRKAKK